MLDLLVHPEKLPFIVDWGAWATLIVGVAAVIGAYKIGVKQTNIADKQVEILARQAAIEDIKLRSDLYDRRIAVYSAARTLVRGPTWNHSDESDRDRWNKLGPEIVKSRFLFDTEMYDWLQAVYSAAIDVGLCELNRKQNFHDQQTIDRLDRANERLEAMRRELDTKFEPYLSLKPPSLP